MLLDDGTTVKNLVVDDGIVSGTTLLDRYEIVELVGKGGMGTVYKARHTLIDNFVAIKVMHPHLLNDAGSQERFKAEAKAAIGLRHERLMAVTDFGSTPAGHPLIVMEFVDGKGLDQILDEQKYLSVEEFFEIFAQVCDGLAYVHEKGVVHRDIKPSNIMLTKSTDDSSATKWLVHIVDFGIAKVLPGGKGAVQHLTQTGEIFGSPLYMSPEQCKGREVDARSDIYSLGCVMFEALTGSPPHQGESAIETLMLHVNQRAPKLTDRRASIGDVEELEKIVAAALSVVPESRYQTINHLKKDLVQRKFTGPLPAGSSESCPVPYVPSAQSAGSGRSLKSAVLSTVLIIVAAAITVWLANAFRITQPRVVIAGSTSEQKLHDAELNFQLAQDKMARGFIAEAADYSQRALDLRLKDAPDTLWLADSMNQRADIALQDAQHEALLLRTSRTQDGADSTYAAGRQKRVADDYSNAESLLKRAIAIADARTVGAGKGIEPVRFRNTLVTVYLDQKKFQEAESTLNEMLQLFTGHQETAKSDPESAERAYHDLYDGQYERLYWATNREMDAAKIRLAHMPKDEKYDPAAPIEDASHPFTGVWKSGTFSLDLKQDGNLLSGENTIKSAGFDKDGEQINVVKGSVDGMVAHLSCVGNADTGQRIDAVAVRVANVLVFHLVQQTNNTAGDNYVPDNAVMSASSAESAKDSTKESVKESAKDSAKESTKETLPVAPNAIETKPGTEYEQASEKRRQDKKDGDDSESHDAQLNTPRGTI